MNALLRTAGAMMLVLAAGSGLAQTRSDSQFVPGRVLVKFKDGVTDDRAKTLVQSAGAHTGHVISPLGIHVIDLPPNASEQAFVNAFRGNGEVEFADLDRVLAPSSITPTDPYYYMQWHLPKMAAPDAWSTTTGSSSVVIAIVDTGVDGSHQDLAPQMVAGWNVVDSNTTTTDISTHGTQSAGTAAAATNNGMGSAGVCWQCKIMPVRVTDDTYGFATSSNVAAGITWAADHGARIAAVGYALSDDATANTAAQYFYNKGGLVVMPSGNTGAVDANADNPYVITVGSTDTVDGIMSWSARGNNIDLVAPACNGSATSPNNGYAQACGTSMSAAIVAGVAGLVRSLNSSVSPAQLTSILQQSVDDLGSTGWDSTFGYGRINMLKAVSNANSAGAKVNTTTSLSSNANPATIGQSVTFTASVSPVSATGSVTFFDGGTTLGTGTLSGGVATLSNSSLSAGSHSITASYGGDGADASSTSAVLSQTVNKTNTSTSVVSSLNPSSSGQSVTFTATVSPSTATGSVTFYDSGSAIGSGTVSAGHATFATSSLSAGTHSITASYGGDGNNNGSSSGALSQTVNGTAKANTSTTVGSSLNPSSTGQSVTFTATVSPSTATGSVTFYDGGSAIGSGTLSAGRATFATSSLSAGTHSITAAYGGDANNNGSSSGAISQTVNTTKTNTSTTVASSLNPSTAGQSVTFTATVSASTATGTVTFYDGGSAIGSAGLSSGRATFSTSSLSAGTHSISASYGGDANFNGSTSGAISQSVGASGGGAADFSITASPSSASVKVGTTATFTVSVSPVNGFSGTVSFSVSGASGTFSPASITGSGSTTLSVPTSALARNNTYNLVITATSGSLVHTTAVAIRVHN